VKSYLLSFSPHRSVPTVANYRFYTCAIKAHNISFAFRFISLLSISLSPIECAMAPKRRAGEAIDLTSDDTPFYSSSQSHAHSSSQFPSSSQGYAHSYGYSSSPYRAPKQPRTSHNQTQRTTSGSSQADAIFIDEDEDDEASQEVPDATQAYNQQQYDFTLYGALHTKIVGIQHYGGYATTGEMVVLRREPQNPYDANAIRVLNVQGIQIGHIPRTWAAKLAKYMDERSLLMEAQLTGPKGQWDCPVELKVSFGCTNVCERTLTSCLHHCSSMERMIQSSGEEAGCAGREKTKCCYCWRRR
jgi:hypothetical protein